jgi:recombination protein RecA
MWQHVLCHKLVEVSGDASCARLSMAATFVLSAQQAGETVAWIQPVDGGLYPPDLHDSGIDLQALAVVHMPKADRYGLPRAAEILLRSGGFGLVVLDATSGQNLPSQLAWQGRLLALARTHHSSVVILTHKSSKADSLGALVGLRLEPVRLPRLLDGYPVSISVLKSKGTASVAPTVWQRGSPPGFV